MEPLKPGPTLAELAAAAGLNQAGVALFSGVSTSTISRLWAHPNWLARARGRTLMRLTASVPGVFELVCSLAPARSQEQTAYGVIK